MKTMKNLLVLMAGLCLLFSCSKTDTDDGLSGIDLKAKMVTPEVIIVTPSGNDDTDNLMNAFAEAMSYGPSNVIQLEEGEFHIDLIEVCDFCGSLKGAGKGKTVITVIDDLSIDNVDNQNIENKHHG